MNSPESGTRGYYPFARLQAELPIIKHRSRIHLDRPPNMRVVASAAARALAKATRRTVRPGQIGEGISQGSAGRKVTANRFQSIKTSMTIQTHIGATPLLLSALSSAFDASSMLPAMLEEGEGEEDDDGGRRN